MDVFRITGRQADKETVGQSDNQTIGQGEPSSRERRAPARQHVPIKSVSICVHLWLLCLVCFCGSIHAKSKTGVGLDKISLPSGPGSIEGLGDAFEPQLNSGTSSYSVPIAIPQGVAGFQPNITLRYNSGAGNGPFGVAWSAKPGLSIQRQVEKGLPTYGESDTYTLNGEELVRLNDGTYRTENESAFRRIQREGTGWLVYDKNGTKHYLGTVPVSENPSRLLKPGGGESFFDTFRWCENHAVDVHDNRIEYTYTTFQESAGNHFMQEIRYSIFGTNYHSVKFFWEVRPDSFSSYLSGFQIKTGRRCREIEVRSQGNLVRRYGIEYDLPADDPIETIGPNDAGQLFSLIRKVVQYDNRGTNEHFLPPLRLGYTRFDPEWVARGGFLNPTDFSLGNSNLSITDFNADGLPDFLFTEPQNGTHQVCYNQGLNRFSEMTNFAVSPTGVTLDQTGVSLADYNGDGKVDLVQKAGTTEHFIYYPNGSQSVDNDETSPAWDSEITFQAPFPPFDIKDPSVRTLDLNNDKKMDFMRTTSAGFVYFMNRGSTWEEDGIHLFGEPKMGDLSLSDGIDFADGKHTKLADLNGDRLLDLARVSLVLGKLEIEFWPNKGNGYWGNREQMSGDLEVNNLPLEDAFIQDINGDGLADVLTVAYDHVGYWLNLGNHTFSRRFEVADTPEYIKGKTVLQQADINGNGSTDFLWENFDSNAGGYRIEWVDFIGKTKPNLLAMIDNGIGLRTEMEYRTSTEFYAEALLGDNPWRTRLPFPSWCVSRITKRFGLDLDAVPEEDRYITEFSYHDGYYDSFEKEFRGFAFARKVERGDDRLNTDGNPITGTVHSPSLITRYAFHTGLPDAIDNDEDNLTDEFDVVSGYEEEALKGKVLWTEQTVLTAEFDQLDNDQDGFIDESDEGPGSGNLATDQHVFSREYQEWGLKAIHDKDRGFTQDKGSLDVATSDGRKITYAFSKNATKELIEGPSDSSANNFGIATSKAIIQQSYDYDFYGNQTEHKHYGVVEGGVETTVTYDDEKFSFTEYGYNLDKWIVGLVIESRVEDEDGNLINRSRNYYDNLAFGKIGTRGLVTKEEAFVGTSSTPIQEQEKVPGDPREDATKSVITQYVYDAYGNPTFVRDPLFGQEAGHQREFVYDPVFHTYVTEEKIHTGGAGGILSASAEYDYGSGVVESSTDFNHNTTTYQYDHFFRLVGVVKPGDTLAKPTQVFEYKPGDPVRSLVYNYNADGDLDLQVSGVSPVVSRVAVKARETAGGGTYDIVQITDGAGHKLGTIQEGESTGEYIYHEMKRYTSRGHERDSYLPFFGGDPNFRNPPDGGDKITSIMDAMGRKVQSINPPETVGGKKTSTQTVFLPLKDVVFDEEDIDPGSKHFNTPAIQYKDGLDRLIGVDEINNIGFDTGRFETRYQYDLNDKLIHITDSLQNKKWMRYDMLGRMIFMEDPDRGKLTNSYDDASNLLTSVDAKNQEIQYTYDGANRIKAEDYLDAAGLTPDVEYSYDLPSTVPDGLGNDITGQNPKGQLTKVTDLAGEEHFSYDERSRTHWKLKRIPDPATGLLVSYKNEFAYDSLDRMTRLIYPDGDYIDYQYNTRNLPEAIVGGESGFIISGIDYLASGQLDQIQYGNGVDTNYTYDPRLRLKTLKTANTSLSTVLIDYEYQFDGVSNITRISDLRTGVPTERENTQVFGYDNLYRLTQVDYPTLSKHIAYEYDRIGNMVKKTSDIDHEERGVSITDLGTMSYGGTAGRISRVGRDQNQPGPHALTAVSNGDRSFSYDANGNMENIDGLTCSWDFKDRLISVENDSMRAEYTYDYSDRRIVKKVTPKKSDLLRPEETTHVLYPDRTYEVREHNEHIKYVWNGTTRVARVTRELNQTEKLQRFSLGTGVAYLTLAIELKNAGTYFDKTIFTKVHRYLPETFGWSAVTDSETIPAGTLLRVLTTEPVQLLLQGQPDPSTLSSNQSLPGVGQWVTNPYNSPIEITKAIPDSANLWYWKNSLQDWQVRYPEPLRSVSSTPNRIPVGEALFVNNPAPYEISPPDTSLSIRYYHQDHLGSSNSLTDENGELVSETVNYPFGATRNSHDPRTQLEAYQFTQKEKDGESGLHYFEARYLVSGLNRFASFDHNGNYNGDSSFVDPQTSRHYAYTGNNPMRFIDMSGNQESGKPRVCKADDSAKTVKPIKSSKGPRIVFKNNDPNTGPQFRSMGKIKPMMKSHQPVKINGRYVSQQRLQQEQQIAEVFFGPLRDAFMSTFKYAELLDMAKFGGSLALLAIADTEEERTYALRQILDTGVDLVFSMNGPETPLKKGTKFTKKEANEFITEKATSIYLNKGIKYGTKSIQEDMDTKNK